MTKSNPKRCLSYEHDLAPGALLPYVVHPRPTPHVRDWFVDVPDKKSAKPAAAKKARTPRTETKGAKILEMIRRGKRATLADIMKATGWQAHSVRGFLSTAAKKRGIKIESTKNEAGARAYQIAK
jgi:hypothetical protein